MIVTVGGVDLFFDVEGTRLAPDGSAMVERPQVVCLHGGPGLDHSGFRPALAPLASIAQLIYVDQRGHGRSGRSDPSKWSLARWADDLHEFCDRLGIVKPIVLGTSFGGYVAMACAIRHVDRFAKLILISTSARGTGHPVRRQHVLRAFERRGGAAALEATRRAFDERTREAYADFGRICGPLYNHNPPSPDSLARTMRNPDILPYFERADGEGVTFDLTPGLAAIGCPTLVVGGEDDPMTPIEEQQAIVAAMRPGLARLVSFPRSGHGVLRDNPAGLLAALAAFIVE